MRLSLHLFYWVVLCFVARDGIGEGTAKPNFRFTDLDGVERRPLEPEKNKSGTVLLFYWHDCPVCNSYAPEINRIVKSHTNFTFYIVQVDPSLTRESAKRHARDYQLLVPVLLDSEHQLVKHAKAGVTPEAVVISPTGKVLYRGRIDNLYAGFGKKRPAATQHDLREALHAITVGLPIKNPETKPIGCFIQENAWKGTNSVPRAQP